MPAGRLIKYTSRKRNVRKQVRRTMRRGAYGKQIIRQVASSQVYPFRRFNFKQLVGGTDGVNYSGNITFQLADLPNYTEFTSLFDQYKIGGIKYRWVINRNPDYGGAVVSNVYNTAVQGQYPRIMWVQDYDNITGVPANFAELQQYSKMKEIYLTPDRPYTRWFFFKPARQAVEYEGAVNSSYRPTWKGFIDCASDSAPHCSIRYFGDSLSSNMQLRLECWYYMVFKHVR